MGIGMDSCIIPVNQGTNLYMIQTTDFFTPLVDDPYLNGRISACNVLSDLYACGTPICDNVLMLLGSSVKFTNDERDTVVPLMIKGFNDACTEAGTKVRGGHTLVNPWPLIGGVATTVTSKFIAPTDAKVGDKLVLTKPLGTQIAVNMFQWRDLKKPRFVAMASEMQALTDNMYDDACVSMATLNRVGAEAMQKFDAHGGTDITGFGILGHAENLCKAQDNQHLTFELDVLPILSGAVDVDDHCKGMFKLVDGFSAETSGGLLVCLSPDKVAGFQDHVENGTGIRPWVIGSVREEDKNNPVKAQIVTNVTIVSVSGLIAPDLAK